MDGSRIVSLIKLKEFIDDISQHASTCRSGSIEFLGSVNPHGMSCTLLSICQLCGKRISVKTSSTIKISTSDVYAVNAGAVLGQLSTGGGEAHLEEQLSYMDIPPMAPKTFHILESSMSKVLESQMAREITKAGNEERVLALQRNDTHEGVPSITVIVDGGWSKRSHKHSYNANSGVGVIFGAVTKKLLFIGVRNRYCSICAIAKNKGTTPKQHQCFLNWTGSSCAMEPDIITEGFQRSEEMHGLRYMRFIGDGDSSVFHNIVTSVTYGRHVKKEECANHAVKCYRTRLEAIVKDNSSYGGRGGLTKEKIKRITTGARCAIKYHSKNGDVEGL